MLKQLICLSILLLLSTGLAYGAQAPETRIPVILSTDVGNEIDDQWTIVYTLVNPQLEVLGIISAHAPTISPPAGHTSYRILLEVVEHRLRMVTHPPLLEGASLPLADTKTPQASPGAKFLIETSRRFSKDKRLTVLMIGAGTDVASAILMDPTIVDRIRLVHMGFTEWPKGGDEFNVANDIKAVQVILGSDVPVVTGSARVCRESLSLSLDQAREMVSNRGPIGRWLWEEFQAWYYRFVKPLRKNDFSKPWIIWDNIVLAYILGMTTQETYARPRLKDDMHFAHIATGKTITWITDVDEKRMWADFFNRLDAYQQTHAVGHGSVQTRLTFMMP